MHSRFFCNGFPRAVWSNRREPTKGSSRHPLRFAVRTSFHSDIALEEFLLSGLHLHPIKKLEFTESFYS